MTLLRSFKLKNIVIQGLWNFIERFYTQLIRIFGNIVLARLLYPQDYGKIGMILIFIVLGRSFTEGGFINALIYKQDRDETDYSTVFYFNILISLFFYVTIFFSAPLIAHFYNISDLTLILRVTSLVILFDALSIIPRAQFMISLNFQIQAYANSLALTLSFLVAILLANYEFGVWALVSQILISSFFTTLFLFIKSKWKPIVVFSVSHLKGLFQYGTKLLFVNLLDRVFIHIYYTVIGKKFGLEILGIYSRADQLSRIPYINTSGLIQTITFPKLCKLQNDMVALKAAHSKNLRLSSLITFPIMIFLIFYREQLVIFFLTTKWIELVDPLMLLSIFGCIYIVNFLNLNILNAINKTSLYVKLELFLKLTSSIILFFTFKHGLLAIILGQITTSFFYTFFTTYYMKKFLRYDFLNLAWDYLPFLFLSLILTFISVKISILFEDLVTQLLIGFLFTFSAYMFVVINIKLLKIKSLFGEFVRKL